MEEIKRLYAEAGSLHTQAKAILDEAKGQELPAEKAQQVDALLNQVEAKTAEAKRRERSRESERLLSEPDVLKNLYSQTQTGGTPRVTWQGKELDADELAELKSMAPFPGYLSAFAPDYSGALRAYLRKGKNRLNENQIKALSVGDAQAGGYLVQDAFLSELVVKAREVSAMRRISRVLPPVPSGSVITPSEDSVFSDFDWTTELATGSEDSVKPFGQRRLQPHPMAKRVKVSNTLMRNPAFDVEGYVRDRLAYKSGVTAENGFINGTGAQQALGVLNTSGLTYYTTADSLVVSADDIINWVYGLPAAYAGRARILCNRAFIRKVRTLKTGLGDYIWQPGLQIGSPNVILDTPYELSDRYDDGLDATDIWEANAVVAMIGDFGYYWIVDAMSIEIQRLSELYAETNQTGFIGRLESDGMAVLSEAFYGLKVKA